MRRFGERFQTLAIRKFPDSLTTFASEGFSPRTSTFGPSDSNKGLQRLTASVGPAATTARRAGFGGVRTPKTGHEMNSCPAAECAAVSLSLNATPIVLHEMWIPPRGSEAQNAAIAENLRLQRRIVGNHRHDDSCAAGIGERCGNSRAVGAQRFRAWFACD